MNFRRGLNLPKNSKESFFLWGPRQVGKTTLLKESFPTAHFINLLRTEDRMRFLMSPSDLRGEVLRLPPDRLVVIDEIQKVPELLNEVHLLIEEHGRSFALCGSSARKVRRGHANLLGGRALRFEMLGLSAHEIGNDFDLTRALNFGLLPRHYLNEQPIPLLRAYVDDYLKEEILEESIVRNVPAFSDFLRIAALGDTEMVNVTNIARECHAAASTVRDHFQILSDTLLGSWLPAYVHRQKRRVLHAPKFYFRDLGVVRHLAKRGDIQPGSELFGKAFENWVFHELSTYSRYSGLWFDLSYWRTSSGFEVDFVVDNAAIAIEVKAKTQITSADLKGLLAFQEDNPTCKKAIVVSCVPASRRLDSGIEILSWKDFIADLWGGALLT